MRKIIDLTGQKFSRLTVISFAPTKKKMSHWNVVCDCGTKTVVDGCNLKKGHTKSCGCLQVERIKEHNTTHNGCIDHPLEYGTWKGIKQRCNNINNHAYKDYGGRGITVCDRWLNSFENFLADMGRKPTPQHSLDRINNNGNYEPSNCRWATRTEQNRNTRANVRIMFQGEMRCLAEVAEISGLDIRIISTRLKRGWPDPTLPLRKDKRRK